MCWGRRLGGGLKRLLGGDDVSGRMRQTESERWQVELFLLSFLWRLEDFCLAELLY